MRHLGGVVAPVALALDELRGLEGLEAQVQQLHILHSHHTSRHPRLPSLLTASSNHPLGELDLRVRMRDDVATYLNLDQVFLELHEGGTEALLGQEQTARQSATLHTHTHRQERGLASIRRDLQAWRAMQRRKRWGCLALSREVRQGEATCWQ